MRTCHSHRTTSPFIRKMAGSISRLHSQLNSNQTYKTTFGSSSLTSTTRQPVAYAGTTMTILQMTCSCPVGQSSLILTSLGHHGSCLILNCPAMTHVAVPVNSAGPLCHSTPLSCTVAFSPIPRDHFPLVTF